MSTKVPPLLYADTYDLYTDVSDERVTMRDFINQIFFYFRLYVRSINSDIYEKIPNTKDKVMYWVGGSRAWFEAFNCMTNEYLLKHKYYEDRLQVSAEEQVVITPGNLDVFYACKYKEDAEIVWSILQTKLTFLLEELQHVLYVIHKKQFRLRLHNINKKRLEEEFCNFVEPCRTAYITIEWDTAADVDQVAENVEKQVNEKLVIYFEVDYLPMVDIPLLANRLTTDGCVVTDLKFLNIHGLYYFLETITRGRTEKVINVDKLRRNLFDRIVKKIGGAVERNTEIDEKIETFWLLFHDTPRWGKYKYVLDNMFKAKVTQLNPDLFDDIESKVLNMCGDNLDAFLRYLNESMSKRFKGKTCLFKVGGSALQYYLGKEQVRTSDMDAKLLYTTNVKQFTEKNRRELYGKIAQEIAVLGSLLTDQDWTALESTIEVGDGIVCRVGYELRFRPRYLSRDDFDLFSLDCRVKLEFKTSSLMNGIVYENNRHFWWDYVSSNGIYEYYFDIAMLDVVLAESDEVSKCGQIRTVVNGVPYASKIFLRDDFNKTYNNLAKARMRDFSGKREKDRTRYELLIQSDVGTNANSSEQQQMDVTDDGERYNAYTKSRADALEQHSSLIKRFVDGVMNLGTTDSNKFQLKFAEYTRNN